TRYRYHVRARGVARRLIRLTEDDARTITFDRAHFYFGRVRLHHDVRRNSSKLRRARQGRSMITRRMRRHAALRGSVIERKDRVGRAARLERANLLKIFAFK